MPDTNVFRHGAVQFPLTSSTANSLLQDADPALFHALAFFAAAIRIHVGDRLLAQARLEGLNLQDAVAQTLHYEPSPNLLANQFKFPTLAIYRRGEEDDEESLNVDMDVSEWEFAYVLPSLNPRQVEQLQPILRAVSRVIAKAAKKGRDNGYLNGADVWKLAGIEKAKRIRAHYGGYDPIDENKAWFRAIVGTIKVVELDQAIDDVLPMMGGVTANLDLQASDETVVPDIAVTSTYPAPTLTSLVPSLGTKAGGTTVTISGTGFRVGTPVRVIIGGAECRSAEVLSSTQVRAVTPPHEAFPTFDADVVVIDVDGQQASLPYAFQFTTP